MTNELKEDKSKLIKELQLLNASEALVTFIALSTEKSILVKLLQLKKFYKLNLLLIDQNEKYLFFLSYNIHQKYMKVL